MPREGRDKIKGKSLDRHENLSWGSHVEPNDRFWTMLDEFEREENRVVLFGNQKGSIKPGTRIISCLQDIAAIVFPEEDPTKYPMLAEKMRNKLDNCKKMYKSLVKELQSTGAGVGGANVQDDVEMDGNRILECYVGGNGPDEQTSDHCRNIWQQCTAKMAAFPRFHALCHARANVSPPSITTGVGPHGPQTTYLRPPGTARDVFSMDLLDPNLHDEDGRPQNLPPTNIDSSTSTVGKENVKPLSPAEKKLKKAKVKFKPARRAHGIQEMLERNMLSLMEEKRYERIQKDIKGLRESIRSARAHAETVLDRLGTNVDRKLITVDEYKKKSQKIEHDLQHEVHELRNEINELKSSLTKGPASGSGDSTTASPGGTAPSEHTSRSASPSFSDSSMAPSEE